MEKEVAGEWVEMWAVLARAAVGTGIAQSGEACGTEGQPPASRSRRGRYTRVREAHMPRTRPTKDDMEGLAALERMAKASDPGVRDALVAYWYFLRYWLFRLVVIGAIGAAVCLIVLLLCGKIPLP